MPAKSYLIRVVPPSTVEPEPRKVREPNIAKVTVELEPNIYRKLLTIALEHHETVGDSLSGIIAPLVINEMRRIRKSQIERRQSFRRAAKRRHKRR